MSKDFTRPSLQRQHLDKKVQGDPREAAGINGTELQSPSPGEVGEHREWTPPRPVAEKGSHAIASFLGSQGFTASQAPGNSAYLLQVLAADLRRP